jgi:hypothetical protein
LLATYNGAIVAISSEMVVIAYTSLNQYKSSLIIATLHYQLLMLSRILKLAEGFFYGKFLASTSG